MNHRQLAKQITALASLHETESPMVSAYLDLREGPRELRTALDSWARLARATLAGRPAADFEDAVDEVARCLTEGFRSEAQGAAVFARWGEHPLVLPMAFDVPFETAFHVGTLPVIYPLVELKDRFHRFVVVITDARHARIFEISLGAASESLLARRPELNRRVGREWTRAHYQNHRRDRERKFVKEKLEIIQRLMRQRGHNHLVIAGDPRFVNRLRETLPADLAARVIRTIKTRGTRDEEEVGRVLQEAVEAFVAEEERESLDVVARLDVAIRTDGLGVVGFGPTLTAIREGFAEQLVILGSLPLEEREELVREAAQRDLPVETVRESTLLEQNGGVGCLLRYRPVRADSDAEARPGSTELADVPVPVP